MTDEKVNCLVEWFNNQDDSTLPKIEGASYKARLASIKEELAPILEMIGACASAKEGDVFTDHGPRHVEMVIERASALLTSSAGIFPQISHFEAYILLVAIYFHDAGNIFGRDGHEKKAKMVLDKFGSIIGNNNIVKNAVEVIVRSHAAPKGGSPDTISSLLKKDRVFGKWVRFQFLAAILKFADELADDYSRVSQSAMELGAIPPRSQIYYFYSKSLHAVIIKPECHQIELDFDFLKAEASVKYQKGRSRRYLQDEIIHRSLKMFNEMKYCMRFTVGTVYFDKILVSIRVRNENGNEVIPRMTYNLTDEGYPSSNSSHFASLGKIIKNGDQLYKYLNKRDE